MYLSRVEVDTNNRQKIKDLSHLGSYHNWVEQSFPNEISEKKRLRHLWRIDHLNGRMYILVLSEEKPDPERLARYGVRGSVETKEYDHYLSKIKDGQNYRFRLTANPTHKVTRKGEKRGKIYPHITITQQKSWLIDRAKNLGFAILKNKEGLEAFDVVERGWPLLYHGRKQIKLSRVSFEGILKVLDADLLKKALTKGIGREKAYGMGLMTIIPLTKS